MKNSSTCHRGSRWHGFSAKCFTGRLLGAGLLVACLCGRGYAIDPSRALSQYIHDVWGADRNFPGGQVYALAQTSDGYLWIGTENGLVRFDGLNFQLFQHSETPQLPAAPVLGLIADSSGNLWIELQAGVVLRYHDGVFENILPPMGTGPTTVTAMCRAKSGQLLLTEQNNGVLTYDQGKFDRLAPSPGIAGFIVLSIAEGPDGRLWLGTRQSGLATVNDGKIAVVAKDSAQQKLNCLLPFSDQRLWVGTDNGVLQWDGTALVAKPLSPVLDRGQILSMVRDRDSNIWIGTASGLFRVAPDGTASTEAKGTALGNTTITDAFGDEVTALFEDREANIWIGGPRGLQRLRDSAFTTYSQAEGLPSESNGPVYIDSDRRVWFAPVTGGLYSLAAGKVEPVTEAGLARDVIYSITGRKDELWIGRQNGGLTHLFYKDGVLSTETYTQTNGLAQDHVYAVYQTRDGTVWAGTLSGGVSKFSGGKFTTYTTASGLASNSVSSILEASDGTMWFATLGGVCSLSKNGWQTYTTTRAPSPAANCLFQDTAGTIWIGTDEGLAFLDEDQIRFPHEPALLNDPVLGIAEDNNGSLWIATSHHVLRASRNQVLSGKLDERDIRQYGIVDGLHGTEGVKRQRSVVEAPSGKIWFSLNRGLSVIDPIREAATAPPPLVSILMLVADGAAIEPRRTVDIPAGSQRIVFGYSGISLSVPERVRYRYMLDGFDHGWSDAVTGREAAYTNLAPRKYRFRVMACNADGVWNSREADLDFEIEPMFWQTLWFQLSAIVAAGLAIFALYRFRLLQIARQLNVRFEERLAERTLIAQELHDTLLQGFLSVSMQLHVARDRLPAESPVRPSLDRILRLMRQVIDEGRNAVRGLRSTPAGSLELGTAFSRVHEELGSEEQAAFRVVIEGRPMALHPVIRDEVYRIGREAIVNAFRHAQAKNIEVEIDYASRFLRILVRDDGRGIDPHVLETGREGHWGLPGMRERAEGVEARLKVLSRAGAGTEVELLVPAHIAFQNYSRPNLLGWITRLFPKKQITGFENRQASEKK
ncbi:MAG TPA: two-component regulator propeller domain-containing protein [Blastocatellia bacterium]